MIEKDLPKTDTRRVLSTADIAIMDRTPRAMLINSLPGYKPAMLVGTCGEAGQTNLAIISSHFHLGSNPPLLALIVRPSLGRSERHTLDNILENRCWTLNSFTLEEAAMAHQTSAPYPRAESEFDACHFDAHWIEGIAAPFVDGAALCVGCELREHQALSINGTHLVIGEIVHLSFPLDAQRGDGSLDLMKMEALAVSGLDTYSLPAIRQRFAVAEVHRAPEPL
jgi:flavin reductase (DIM6/NTAB) family NADH-FMN oxidoreductase RutF